MVLEGGEWRFDEPEQGIDGQSTQGGRGGILLVIGEHAVADSAEIGVYVQLYGLLDLLGFQPAGLGRRFQRPRFGLFPIDLAGRLSLFSVHRRRSENDRIDRAVTWGREGKGLDGVRARIEANVGWRIVDIVRIGGRIHVVGPNLLGPVGQARVGVDEERQIGPILHEGLVVGLLVDDVADPREHEGAIGAGAHRQPDISLGGLGRQIRIDHNGFHPEIRARIYQAMTAMGRLGGVGLASPQHEYALGVVAPLAIKLGVVHNAHPAIDIVHIYAAVEPNRRRGNEISGHSTLTGTRGQGVAASERVVETPRLPFDIGTATPASTPVGVRAVLFDSRCNLLARKVGGLVPGNRLPLVLAPIAHPLHGMQHMARAVDRLNLGEALQAHTALVERAVGVSFNLHHHTVLGVHANGAAVGTAMARRLVLLALGGTVGKGLINLVEQDRRASDAQSRRSGRGGFHEATPRDRHIRHRFSSRFLSSGHLPSSKRPSRAAIASQAHSPSLSPSIPYPIPGRRSVPACPRNSSAAAAGPTRR